MKTHVVVQLPIATHSRTLNTELDFFRRYSFTTSTLFPV